MSQVQARPRSHSYTYGSSSSIIQNRRYSYLTTSSSLTDASHPPRGLYPLRRSIYIPLQEQEPLRVARVPPARTLPSKLCTVL